MWYRKMYMPPSREIKSIAPFEEFVVHIKYRNQCLGERGLPPRRNNVKHSVMLLLLILVALKKMKK